MTTAGLSDEPVLEPRLTPDERTELVCLAYHLDEVGRLRDRGLIPEASHATIVAEAAARREAIEARGRGRAALESARRVARHDPRAAARWAARARQADPSGREAWDLELDLLRRLDRADEAVALASEAVALFPDFPGPDALRAEFAARAASVADDTVRLAREALDRGDDARVAAICEAKLAEQPDHFDATVLLAFACQRQGRLDEALGLYERLVRLRPGDPAWGQWVRNVRARMSARPAALRPFGEALKGAGREPAPAPVLAPAPVPAAPRVSWKDVAGEFLQDHWQKLILCLAVLLIVVSSNVGAYQLLGPRLWSPVGKSVLALVYTAMFAALGAGLVRWGAERAGRIMLLTTLIVIPADFMLVGEMGLLVAPSASRLAILGFDTAALFVLTRVVVGALGLGLKRGAGALAAALFAVSAFNAAVPAPGWPWGAQFAVFLAPVLLLAAAEVWLTGPFLAGGGEEAGDRRESAALALGLLAFACVSGVVRTGAVAMELPATLYAAPVMVLAACAVHAAGRLGRLAADPRPAAWLRFAGLALSGLAFALALARPEGAVYSGSTLAAALIGLGLYAALLRRERHPAYLYIGFGALFVVYFGAFYFVSDLLRSFEQVVGRALGYERKLPLPFKSINGLVFSPVLAGLSLYFRRAWGDGRLARHCHYLGVPFAVGACAFSAFEPKAAVICLSGYAVLFALAVPVFAAPAVTYLAAAALMGAVSFGSTLWPGTTLADRALLASALGLGYWAAGMGLSARGAAARYRRPLDHAALGAAGLAALGAAVSVVPPAPVALSSASAMLLVALVAALVNADLPSRWLGYAAALGGCAGLDLLALYAGDRWAGGLGAVRFAAAAAGVGLVSAAVGSWLWGVVGRLGASVSDSGPVGVFPEPLFHAAMAQVTLALALGTLHAARVAEPLAPGDFGTGAVGLGLAAGALVLLTRPYPLAPLAHLSLACGLGVALCLFQVAIGGGFAGRASYGAVGSGYALGLLALEEAARAYAARRKTADADFAPAAFPTFGLFARALTGFEVAAVLGAVALAAAGFENGPALIATLALGALAMLWSTRLRPVERLVDLAVGLAVAAVLCETAWRLKGSPGGAVLAWLAASAAGSALALWAVAVLAAARPALALYAAPSARGAAVVSWLVFVLAPVGALERWQAYPVAAGALGMNAGALALLAAARRRPVLTYRAVVSFALGVYVVVLSAGTARPDSAYVLGLVAVLLGLACSGLGFWGRSGATPENNRDRVFARPLFASAAVLTALAVIPAYRSPGTMGLVAVSFLLLVKGIPSREWLYAVVASLAVALDFGVLVHWPPSRVVVAAVVAGYQLWLVGLFVRRAEPALVRLFGLPGRGYDVPLFNSAAAACAVGAALRVGETLDGALAWPDSAPLALNFAVFALLMIKAYPSAGWVHLAVALASLSAGLAAYPRVTDPTAWLPVGMALAAGWLAVARLVGRHEPAVCAWCGVPEMGYAGRVGLWSRAFFAVTAAATAILVATVMTGALAGTFPTNPGHEWAWAGVLLALALGAGYTSVTWPAADRVALAAGLLAQAVLAVWWLGAPVSPLVARLGMDPRVYLPVATAATAALTAVPGLGLAGRRGWLGVPWLAGPGEESAARLDALAARAGLGLSVLAAVMTRGEPGATAAATFALASVAPAAWASARGWVLGAYAAGVLAASAGGFAGAEVARRAGGWHGADAVVAAGAGLLAATAALWALAGRLRRGGVGEAGGEPTELPSATVPLALEQTTLLAALVSVGLVVFPAMGITTDPPGRAAEVAGVGVLFGAGLVFIGLVARWGAEWLVYAAQAALLGGFLLFRHAFPFPAPVDAVVLTVLGYLNLGLAEAMHRLGLGRFARPTRYVALALPLLPVALAAGGGLEGQRLFVLFAAATFYGIACYAIEWKALRYAAAVLYNAFLWLLWGRIGWSLADHSAFFLVPVGLSAVLFAEVNRAALGRSAVNAIRGVGLSVIYLTMAAPVWQSAGFGAWLALLLVSIAGIFVGIGLRVQLFLWFGLAGFVLDVVYQLGRVGREYPLAKWGTMLVLGLLLVLFVALNEKKRIVVTMREYLDRARQWE